MRIDLDSGRRHYLLVSRDAAGAWRLELHHSSASRRSALHAALLRHLVTRAGTHDYTFPPTSDALTLPQNTGGFDLLLGSPLRLARVVLESGVPAVVGDQYVLSPFESRFLADNGHPHPVPADGRAAPANLTTDLHVHFAGCVAADDLVRIGADCGTTYPAPLLADAGIRVDAAAVALRDLPPDFRRRLAAEMAIPLDRQITFREMERIYRLRSPITKDLAAFVPLCRQLAADYAAMGVRYVELSLSNVLSADWLTTIHRQVPAIERASGVTIRFLAALNRHDDYEWDLDCIDRLHALRRSRYIVGCDFMGQETNSTRAFARQLALLAEQAGRDRPGFVLRVHAGENPAHPENVRVALESVAGHGVQLRIGHGLYGVDDATLGRLRDANAIVEFNLNSNFALNNIQCSAGAPIARYVRAGAPVVLGSDGYGIYQTTLEAEAQAARLCGLGEVEFVAIRATEATYVARRRARDAAATDEPSAYVVPAEAPPCHYTPQVMTDKRQAVERRDAALKAKLDALRVPVVEGPELDNLLRGKRCLCVAGAWNKAWQAVSPTNQARVREVLAELLAALDAERTVLVTGGTQFGVEGVVQELARPLGLTVLGALVKETPPDSLQAGTMTDACLIGERLYDKAAALYPLMKRFNALCLFIGGGMIVSDEIQTAANLRLRYLLMDGPEGASSDHAAQQPERAFRTASDVLRALADARPWSGTDEPYWHLGPNPTVDAVLTRRAPDGGALQVLLIRRDVDAPTEGGKWALPGGFQHTDAPRGAPWQPGVETPEQACLRELVEETGVDLRSEAHRLRRVGIYEGGGRDPRDAPESWSRSHVFALHLPDALADAPLCGADDACDARWFDALALPPELAFDHARILGDALSPVNE